MRDFFISSFEKLVSVIVILLMLGTVVGAVGASMTPDGGLLFGVAVLIGGGLYTILVGGMLYLALGIYNNTKRTAEAVEQLAAR